MPNILVVDDEADVLEAISRTCRLAGHNVTTARGATEALRLCVDHSFDVVVLDYIMPSMTGIELLNRIRAHQPAIRSVIVSGKIDAQVPEEMIAAELRESVEADAYLHKPLSNDVLLETVSDLVKEAQSREWKEIAERNLNARKSGKRVTAAEKALGSRRSPKGLK